MQKAILGLSILGLLAACGDGGEGKGKKNPALPNLVAAGDTTDTSTVLWARASAAGPITFTYGTNRGLRHPLGDVTGTVTDPAIPVKVLVSGLTPGTRYHYEARDSAGVRARGRFRTAPDPTHLGGLRFGVSGDWRGDLSPYPCIVNAFDRDLDFFVAHGDTVYADVPSPDLPLSQALTLSDFRIKYNEVYSDTLATLRSITTTYATIDDHEVTNDFAGGAPPGSDARFSPCGTTYINDCILFENGLQAFHEYHPIEDLTYGVTGDPRTEGEWKLYRHRRYGRTAAVIILDARSFRDEPITPVDLTDPADIQRFETESFDPSRTFLGAEQLADLQTDLLAAETDNVLWKFVLIPEPIQNLSFMVASDRYEGYAYERTQLLQFIDTNAIRNVVFIAADFHGTLVNNITYQQGPGQPHIPIPAFEVTTGPVAYAPPFGPTVVAAAESIGMLGQPQLDDYSSRDRDGQDAFVEQVVNIGLAIFGYDLLGIEATSGVHAVRTQGRWTTTHVYGWTELDVDPITHDLTVTTYGIEWYTTPDPKARPGIICQFRVTPN